MLPILYTFRRCPYAMRARMAIAYAGIEVEIREVLLKEKPAEMLALSPKGTVPVLQLTDGTIIDQSLEVMHWALEQYDPQTFLTGLNSSKDQNDLIQENDESFKHWLDRYKYHVGYPEQSQQYYRQQAEAFIQQLDKQLEHNKMLFSDHESFADLAIFPFVRQFAMVDLHWFENSRYQNCYRWLQSWLEHQSFKNIMQKFPVWNNKIKIHHRF